MSIHQCRVEFEYTKHDGSKIEIVQKCTGNGIMSLDVWYVEGDDREYRYEDIASLVVNFCPFCGIKSETSIGYQKTT